MRTLRRLADAVEHLTTLYEADLRARRVIGPESVAPPPPQDLAEVYARAVDLEQFDQERQRLARVLGRDPLDEEVLAFVQTRDTAH